MIRRRNFVRFVLLISVQLIALICADSESNEFLAELDLQNLEENNATSTSAESDGSGWPLNLPKAEVYVGTEVDTLTLLSNVSDSDVLIGSDQVIAPGSAGQGSPLFQNVVLVCSAEYPVVWTYEGDGAPIRMFSSEIRTFEDFQNSSTYEYFTTLVLMQERNNEHLTGTYTCQSAQNSTVGVHYHLYFPGAYGFPTIRNRVIEVPTNVSQVVLPCKATNPTLPMTLFKIHPKEEASNLTASEALTYNPRLGFTLNMRAVRNPYGTYYCSVNDSDSFWKIDLVPQKFQEFTVSPPHNLIQLENFANQTLKCESKEKILFGFPNSAVFGSVDYSQNLSQNFPYVGIFSLNSDFPLSAHLKYFKVQCLNKRNRRVLHTWEFSSVGPEEISINYDKNLRRVLCCSKSGLSPRYDFVKCETLTDCAVKSKCFENGRCEYPFPPSFVDAPPGCTAVEFLDRIPTHLLKCSVGDKSRQLAILETVDHSGMLEFDLESSVYPPTEQILKITMLGLKQDTNEIKIQCSGSLFYFSTKFVFALEKMDGSLEFPESEFLENEETHEPILRMEMSSEIKNIICFAPLSRTSEWRNATLPVVISEPSSSSSTTTVRAHIRSSSQSRRRSQSQTTSDSINVI